MHLVVPAEADRTERLDGWTTIHHVRAARSPWFDRRYRLLRPDHYWSRRSPVGRILATVRPDLIEVCDKYTLSQVGRLARAGWYWAGHRPTVVGLSCERMDDNVRAYLAGGRHLVPAAHAYMRTVYAPSFDAHIANSRYTADELLTAAGVEDVAVRGMGVDAALFAAARPDAALRTALLAAAGGDAASALVLYAGRVSPEKRIEPLLHACGTLASLAARDLRLVIVGDGPSVSSLKALAARVAPGRVHFAGNLTERTTASPSASPRSRRWLPACRWSCRMAAACCRTPTTATRGSCRRPPRGSPPESPTRSTTATPPAVRAPGRRRPTMPGRWWRGATSTCWMRCTRDA
jgi:glycosyltransferase involved in cell wall biosynthesis